MTLLPTTYVGTREGNVFRRSFFLLTRGRGVGEVPSPDDPTPPLSPQTRPYPAVERGCLDQVFLPYEPLPCPQTKPDLARGGGWEGGCTDKMTLSHQPPSTSPTPQPDQNLARGGEGWGGIP